MTKSSIDKKCSKLNSSHLGVLKPFFKFNFYFFIIENDEESSTPASPSKSDIIIISGLKDACEKAKEALLALVPTNENFDFPQKFHMNLLVNKAEVLRDLSNKFNVQINVPKKGNLEHNFTKTLNDLN